MIQPLSDSVSDTIDYGILCEEIEKICSKSSYRLIEALGLEIVTFLQKVPGILNYTLKINKPNAIKNAQEIALVFDSENFKAI